MKKYGNLKAILETDDGGETWVIRNVLILKQKATFAEPMAYSKDEKSVEKLKKSILKAVNVT